MITVKVYNDETEQAMLVEMKEINDGQVNVSITFDPSASNQTKDTYGVMKKVMDALTTGD